MDRAAIKEKFLSLETPRNLAELLEVDYGKHLTYHLYRTKKEGRYKSFKIKKKSGGWRTIRAPITHIKTIQSRLLIVLNAIYVAKPSVHGFLKRRSILTNASAHSRPRFVLNVDLKDFFPSINFGRVRGLFMATPYKLPAEVATVIAQICCHDNELPQGAPTSPVISNILCAKMDSNLQRLAREFNCFYSRYADDLTFSTRLAEFPKELANRKKDGDKQTVIVGPKLKKVIIENGFEINQLKVRLHFKYDRQEVTGLVVNEFTNVRRTYVRQIRAMLHSWKCDGLDGAQQKFEEKYHLGNRHASKEVPHFEEMVRGKLEFLRSVRGDGNPTYRRLALIFNSLNPKKQIVLPDDPLIEKLKNAVVVIECNDERQGTGFFLKDVGIITCHHCLAPNPIFYYPDQPSERYPLTLLAENAAIDLAVLSPPPEFQMRTELERGASDIGDIGHKVALAGFPSFAPGKSLSFKDGKVTGFQVKSTIQRYQLSMGIVAGASGRPIITSDGKVVGIAVTGADADENVDNTVAHGAIPISALDHLI